MNQRLAVVRAPNSSTADKPSFENLTIGQRRALARQRVFAPTQRFKDILVRLDELMIPEMSTYPLSYLLVGESGTGKTTLLNTFAEKHKTSFDRQREQDIRKVVYVEMPVEPRLGTFYNALIDVIGYKDVRISPDRRSAFVMDRLSAIEVRVIIVDEVQHVLHTGTRTRQALMDALKVLAGKGCAVVASGTREALAAFRSNPQVSRRFETLELPRFKLDEEFRQLLVTVERALPLSGRSGFSDRQMAQDLHSMSEGLLGKLWRILERAALLAIDEGQDAITSAILKRSLPTIGG